MSKEQEINNGVNAAGRISVSSIMENYGPESYNIKDPSTYQTSRQGINGGINVNTSAVSEKLTDWKQGLESKTADPAASNRWLLETGLSFTDETLDALNNLQLNSLYVDEVACCILKAVTDQHNLPNGFREDMDSVLKWLKIVNASLKLIRNSLSVGPISQLLSGLLNFLKTIIDAIYDMAALFLSDTLTGTLNKLIGKLTKWFNKQKYGDIGRCLGFENLLQSILRLLFSGDHGLLIKVRTFAENAVVRMMKRMAAFNVELNALKSIEVFDKVIHVIDMIIAGVEMGTLCSVFSDDPVNNDITTNMGNANTPPDNFRMNSQNGVQGTNPSGISSPDATSSELPGADKDKDKNSSISTGLGIEYARHSGSPITVPHSIDASMLIRNPNAAEVERFLITFMGTNQFKATKLATAYVNGKCEEQMTPSNLASVRNVLSKLGM